MKNSSSARNLIPASKSLAAIYIMISAGMFYLLWVIIGSTNKGIDWTDEAWVYELNRNLSPQRDQTWGFQYFGHLFFLITDGNLLQLRILRLLFFILTNYVLVLTIGKYILNVRFPVRYLKLGALLISVLSTFFTYSYFPRSFGYNEFASWVTTLILVSLVLVKQQTIQDSRVKIALTIFLLGILNTSLFFIKFTSGAVMIMVTTVLLLVNFSKSDKTTLILRTIFFVCGLLIVPITIQILSGQALFYFRNVLHVLSSSSAQTEYLHSIESILPLYLNQFQSVLWNLIQLAVFPFALVMILLISLVSRKEKPISKELIGASFVLGIGIILLKYPIVIQDKWTTIGNLSLALWIVNSVFLSCILRIRLISSYEYFIMIIVNSLPFIVSLGTVNPIGGQTMIGNSGLLITLFFICIKLMPDGLSLPLTAALLASLSIIISPSVIHGNTIGMYRIPSTDVLTSSITEIPELGGILVTKEESEQYDWLAREVRKLPTTATFVPIISPGFNFAITNNGFASIWTDTWWPVSFTNLEYSCSKTDKSGEQLIVIAPSVVPQSFIDRFNVAISECNLNFSRDFIKYGADPTNTIQILIGKTGS